MKLGGFQDLFVWGKAHKLVLAVYEISKGFPKTELFGLVSQIRRSSVSICANIAEGYKKSTKDFVRFLEIAQGSLEETKYHLILSRDLNYFSENEFNKLFNMCNETGYLLYQLIKKLR